jgi:hypothetical protein
MLVVEAVDQLGPVPQANLYATDGQPGAPITPLVNPLPAGAMLGNNKGLTADGNVSTNGHGPHTNRPQMIARSRPFVVEARADIKAIPSKASATQQFFDTFENAENDTIRLLSREDGQSDSFGNVGTMTYSLNGGTSKEWRIEYRQADNMHSMPFVANDHFMDMLFDGVTPGVSGPGHTTYGSMAMTPTQTLDMSGGRVVHLTMEVDGHQSLRRWLALQLAPASDPLQRWDPFGGPINNTDRAVFLEFRDGGCTLDIFTGPKSGTDRTPTGTAGGSAHGARLWGGSGAVGGAPIMCGWDQMYNPSLFSKNGLGHDDRSRYDFFISQTHAALFQDGHLIVQSDIPAGSFAWANEPLKAYYSHYLYHTENDRRELKSVQVNGAGMCYPQNAYWFNDAVQGTSASDNYCAIAYPAGYGFPYSDERHWDNMGFEVLPASDVPSNGDFAPLGALVQPQAPQAVQFVDATNLAVSVTPASETATSVPHTAAPPESVPHVHQHEPLTTDDARTHPY